MKKTDAQRQAEWERKYDSLEFVEWGKLGTCCVCGAEGSFGYPNHNHHVRPEGELPVGTGRKASARWICILCPGHHDEAHHGAKTLEAKYNLNLADEARKHWAEWTEE